MAVFSSVYFMFLEVDLNIGNSNTNCAFVSEGVNQGIAAPGRKPFTAAAVFLHSLWKDLSGVRIPRVCVAF